MMKQYISWQNPYRSYQALHLTSTVHANDAALKEDKCRSDTFWKCNCIKSASAEKSTSYIPIIGYRHGQKPLAAAPYQTCKWSTVNWLIQQLHHHTKSHEAVKTFINNQGQRWYILTERIGRTSISSVTFRFCAINISWKGLRALLQNKKTLG